MIWYKGNEIKLYAESSIVFCSLLIYTDVFNSSLWHLMSCLVTVKNWQASIYTVMMARVRNKTLKMPRGKCYSLRIFQHIPETRPRPSTNSLWFGILESFAGWKGDVWGMFHESVGIFLDTPKKEDVSFLEPNSPINVRCKLAGSERTTLP